MDRLRCVRRGSRRVQTSTPLPTPYSVRLVKIKAPTSEWPVRISLRMADIRKDAYIALSYTWDESLPIEATTKGRSDSDSSTSVPDSSARKKILCSGKIVRVRQNLYDALQHIRDTGSTSFFFIDALSINLEDLAKKSRLVGMMGQIYQRASYVVAWLGPKDAHAEDTVNVIKVLTNAIDWRRQRGSFSYPFRDPRFYEDYNIRPITLQQWFHVYHFCRLPYFPRVWVFHELSLAKRVVFLYGDICMDLALLVDLAMVLSLTGWLAGLNLVVTQTIDQHTIPLTEMLGPVMKFRQVPTWHPRNPEATDYMKRKFSLETESQRAYKVLEALLGTTWTFECRDPRDRIFACLSLLRIVYTGLAVLDLPATDYSMSAEDLHRGIAELVLEYTGESSILKKACNGLVGTQDSDNSRGRSEYHRQSL